MAKFKTKEDKQAFWHASSHILADAVKRLWPDVKLGIGPAIEEGFYYDFDLKHRFTPEDLIRIEKEAVKIIKENSSYKKIYKTPAEAKKFLKKETYKLDLLKDIPDKKVSFYQHGKFIDLCAGPLVEKTGQIGAFKLLSVAGAYWRGDEKGPMLQRIYGISFPNKNLLSDFIKKREEAEKRDHIKLGRQLDLFSLHPEGPAFPFFHPKGTVIYNEIIAFVRGELEKRGYEEVRTPLILSRDLWERSGHWLHYKENMYFTKIDKRDFAVKPMNCPGGMIIYKTKSHSYKEFPLKVGEFGIIHRHEKSGVVHGLLRIREGVQDDAHIFCVDTKQAEQEVLKLIDLANYVYKIFKLDYTIELSTRPKKAMGSMALWEKAEGALEAALKKSKKKYEINPGDGAFYGPKIDFNIEDARGRKWQCATIQFDFQMPEKFNLTYIGEDNKPHRPIMLHRTIIGSIERFIGLLIENYAGVFPLWLSPVQVKLLSFTDRNVKYAEKIASELKEVVGDKEEKAKTIAVRQRGVKGVKFGVKVKSFIEQLQKEIETKK
jgi:threonyl-tRNA synthetase